MCILYTEVNSCAGEAGQPLARLLSDTLRPPQFGAGYASAMVACSSAHTPVGSAVSLSDFAEFTAQLRSCDVSRYQRRT
jgi:hypothetical protein